MRITGLHLPPPSCLASVRATRAEGDLRQNFIHAFQSDEEEARSRGFSESLGRLEEWISPRESAEVWCIGCPCGQDHGKIFGVRDNDEFSAPIFYACMVCSQRALIFDPTLHGYNAEIDKRKRKSKKAPNATFALHCRRCKTTVWRPVVLVTYQGELGEQFQARLADYFDVILIGGVCVKCGYLGFRYDAECA